MTLDEYMRDAMRTNAPGFDAQRVDPQLMHAVMGMVTEAGELLDALKKVTAYNKPVDFVNLDEEIGDMMWYIALYCDYRASNVNAAHPNLMNAEDVLSVIMKRNIAKLRKRFPNKFTDHDANNRDLFAERAILEGSGE